MIGIFIICVLICVAGFYGLALLAHIFEAVTDRLPQAEAAPIPIQDCTHCGEPYTISNFSGVCNPCSQDWTS